MNKFVQIGAGASDLDKNYEDGFANFIKKKNQESEIHVVEANSKHIEKLKKSREKNKNDKIYNLAIN